MLRIFRKAWGVWLVVVRALGVVQMVVLLTIVYWVFMPILVIPVGKIADPLRLRNRDRCNWLRRDTDGEDVLESLRRQG